MAFSKAGNSAAVCNPALWNRPYPHHTSPSLHHQTTTASPTTTHQKTPPTNTPLLSAPTKKHVFPGLPHSFTKYPDLPSSRRFNELVVESVRWCLEPNPRADEPGRWEVEMPEGYRGGVVGQEQEKLQREEQELQRWEEQEKLSLDGGMRRWIPELRGKRWKALV